MPKLSRYPGQDLTFPESITLKTNVLAKHVTMNFAFTRLYFSLLGHSELCTQRNVPTLDFVPCTHICGVVGTGGSRGTLNIVNA